jgi:hypothetical protein
MPIEHDSLIQEKLTVLDKILEPIRKFVEVQDQKLPRHPRQTYNYSAFFQTLICFCISEIESLKVFINTYLNKGLVPPALQLPKVPLSTFNDAFERFTPDLFRAVFYHLLSTLKFKQVPELMTLGTLVCIDGS